MKEDILKLLCCVNCHSKNLAIRPLKKQGNDIVEGIILCKKCAITYPIVKKIPCLLLPKLRPNIIKKLERNLLKQCPK